MSGHIHIGLITGATAFASVLAFGIVWRLIAYQFADTDIGKAMLFAY